LRRKFRRRNSSGARLWRAQLDRSGARSRKCSAVRRIREKPVRRRIGGDGLRVIRAPQSIFAIERHFDQVARAINLAPEEFRRRNFFAKTRRPRQGKSARRGGFERPARSRVQGKRLSSQARTLLRAKIPVRVSNAALDFSSFMHGAGFTDGRSHARSIVEMEPLLRVASASWQTALNSGRGRIPFFRKSQPMRSGSGLTA